MYEHLISGSGAHGRQATFYKFLHVAAILTIKIEQRMCVSALFQSRRSVAQRPPQRREPNGLVRKEKTIDRFRLVAHHEHTSVIYSPNVLYLFMQMPVIQPVGMKWRFVYPCRNHAVGEIVIMQIQLLNIVFESAD